MSRRIDWMKTAEAGAKHQQGSRHARRAEQKKLERLRKRYPAEYAEAMRRLEERGI